MIPPSLSRSGFIPVQLLVVINIIATPAAVAFVMSSKMEKSANQAVTTANHRQLGVALVSHTAENGHIPSQQGDPAWDRCLLPFPGYSSTPAGSGNIHSKTTQDLEKVAQISASPADEEPRAKDTYKRSFAIDPWTTTWPNGSSFRSWKAMPYNKGTRCSMLNFPEKAAMVVQWHGRTSRFSLPTAILKKSPPESQPPASSQNTGRENPGR